MAELRVHGLEANRIPRSSELRIHGIEANRIPKPLDTQLNIHSIQAVRTPAPAGGGPVRVFWNGQVRAAVIYTRWNGVLHGPQ